MTLHSAPADVFSPWESYQRMRVKLTSRISRELASATGLSEADYEILETLSRQSEAMRSISLRCGLEWEKSRLSHQLRRMETRGLITRSDCEDDSRSSVVSITPAGREAFETAKVAYDQAVCCYVTNVLTPQQMQQLGDIAEAILPALEEPHRA